MKCKKVVLVMVAVLGVGAAVAAFERGPAGSAGPTGSSGSTGDGLELRPNTGGLSEADYEALRRLVLLTRRFVQSNRGATAQIPANLNVRSDNEEVNHGEDS